MGVESTIRDLLKLLGYGLASASLNLGGRLADDPRAGGREIRGETPRSCNLGGQVCDWQVRQADVSAEGEAKGGLGLRVSDLNWSTR